MRDGIYVGSSGVGPAVGATQGAFTLFRITIFIILPMRCVAAPDSLKNENLCCDHNIFINPAAERPSAT